MADYLNIAGRIRTTASDGVAMEAQEVKDLNLNKSQQEVNADVQTELGDRYTKEETYNREELNELITTPDVNRVYVIATNLTTAVTDLLPATGSSDTLYNVGNWDGTQYDTTVYSIYGWDGTAYVCLAVRSFIGEVYDISANHPDGQGNPTPYADLSAALGTNGANIPANIRRGGMSIKFIQGTAQSSDNKYVQYRLMASTWSTTVTDWQGVDDEPTAGSNNLVKSGGVQEMINNVTNLYDYLNRIKQIKDWGSNLVNPNTVIVDAYIRSDGDIGQADPNTRGYGVTDFIPVLGLNIINNGIISESLANHAVYDINKNFIRTVKQTTQYTYQSGDYYIRFCYRDVIPQCNFGTTLAAYEPYTENATKLNVEKNTQNILDLDANKLAKINGVNLIDPSKLLNPRYITNTGEIRVASDSNLSVSGLIPINGKNIVMFSVVQNSDLIRPWVAYDENLNITRVGTANSNTAIYTFDSTNYPNDKYLRIGFKKTNIQEKRANYGTTLAAYVPYTDYKPVTDLQKDVTLLLNLVDGNVKGLSKKLDKIIGTNLIDPKELKGGKYFSAINGEMSDGDAPFYVSGYINALDANGIGQDIKSNAIKVNYACSFVVYDGYFNIIRWQYGSDGTNQYAYQDGDVFVRFGFKIGSSTHPEEVCLANYGTTLAAYEPYTDYKPIADLNERVDDVEAGMGTTEYELAFIPNCLYLVYNSIVSKQFISRLYMSHLLNNIQLKNSDIMFENFMRNMALIPTKVLAKSETTRIINITPKTKYINKSFNVKQRIVNNATSKDVTPRILVIGDSVAVGYGGISNRGTSWLPTRYWAYAKLLFEMDKIDGGDNANEYNALFVGHADGNFNINYGGVQRLVRAHAEAEGGAALEQLFAATWGNYGASNPFYNSVDQTFSINSYLAKYRTMDDLGVRLVTQSMNPAGESVVGSDGITYTIGTEVNTQNKLAAWDVCTPTHIVINLTHNTTLANYQTYASQVISIIQSQLPHVPIILMTIDEAGGYFPCDYPNYDPSDVTVSANGLHSKNGAIYNYIKQNLENENNGIYLLGAQFTQPTVECYPTIDAEYSENVCRENNKKFQIANTSISARSVHPNNLAHSAFGYSLYGIIKWLIS